MRVFFGGPDRPPGLLRDVLIDRTEAVPAGGEIVIATYYLRNTAFADALLRAHRRGVGVTVCLEASPRLRGANDTVRARLAGSGGLGTGFRAVSHGLPGHLHSKIYVFSHPQPAALVGSFNPSGDTSDDAAILDEIGNQDCGHNYLVETADPTLVGWLTEHVQWLGRSGHGLLERFQPALNAVAESNGTTVRVFPRRQSGVVDDILRHRDYRQVRIAASHFRDRTVARVLARLAARGAQVEVIAHDTRRRVPESVEALARRSGIAFHRYRHPRGWPMHSKFILLEAGDHRRLLFGSMNLTRTSRWLNHEVLVETDDRALYAAFDDRWRDMLDETLRFADPAGRDDEAAPAIRRRTGVPAVGIGGST